MLLVHEVMTRRPITAARDTTIGDLLAQFDQHDVNTIPVVEPAGVLVGIVTKLDLLRVLRAARQADRSASRASCGAASSPSNPTLPLLRPPIGCSKPACAASRS